ncbi:glycoside hydrolase family 13 protein [Xylona heveae TC161]|uniref:alpha-amylase n=1 Tax=Xylona heveae (strain CBS 132557 / TC161) TaxID=1328760 RepID=A0A165JMH7_XYLHT|nr:glycoside hydrolase family 13 protein [Xylona heveae TC161]KZF26425.1 glycoside hydrolase family 13 protein [Xylona heveae TC161]
MRPTTSTKPSTAFISSRPLLTFVCVLVTLVPRIYAANAADWRTRSIYQIITDRFARSDGSTSAPCNTTAAQYCGGSFQGIIGQLDYIQGMGFDAIWISPIVENIGGDGLAGQSYHGFWSKDINAINSNFGTSDDLKELSQKLHSRGMYLMVDIVTNNMAYRGPGQKTDYSQFTPFNDEQYFHKFCYVSNYSNDTNAEVCWLGGDDLSLPDLNTESDVVQKIFNQWGQDLISNYSIDGFRADAAKHVQRSFWTNFVPAVDTYIVGEVYDGDAYRICDYMASDALPAVLNYGTYWTMVYSLAYTDGQNLVNMAEQYNNVSQTCLDATLLGTFMENQDVTRFANIAQKDAARARNVISMTMLTDGIPIIYYGAEQGFAGSGDPQNREAMWVSKYDTSAPLYQTIKTLNVVRQAFKNVTVGSNWSPYWVWKSKCIYSDTNVAAFRKGYDVSVVTVVQNLGSNGKNLGPFTFSDTNFSEGDELLEVHSCTNQPAGQYGNINVTLSKGEPQVCFRSFSGLVSLSLSLFPLFEPDLGG